ncbi:hypothetical protein, conserved in T. vivax [Trypanosoma vivax Y486]|uniref:Leucine-rich repeat protein (LRRP) n=1 Tax=Trypanosoma vivax (strain Y486) TaxID=1055687 RepID=F9WM87_TRYVY|nr:hypothetical protein, conserved in T. vivax [Trypanosoma vivax Y486]|eukprot:CCD18638.1 hypothetical protein, conserved in T. vivax [Trypanosoma vivax Y486]
MSTSKMDAARSTMDASTEGNTVSPAAQKEIRATEEQAGVEDQKRHKPDGDGTADEPAKTQEQQRARWHDVFGVSPEELPDLNELTISDKELGEADLEPLRTCNSLTKLSFERCRGFLDLEVLVGMTRLEELYVFITEIMNHRALLHHKLRKLFLSESQLDDKVTQYLSHMNELEELTLEHVIESTDLSGVAQLPRVRFLRLYRVHIPEDSLVAFSKSKSLTKIEFDTVSTPDFSHLAELQTLEEVMLGCHLYTKGIGALWKLPHLHYLKTTAADLTNEDVRELSQSRSLKDLRISGSFKLTDVAPLSNLETLEQLYLHFCIGLKHGFGALSRLRRLHSLDMSMSPIDGAALQGISTIHSLVSLRFLASENLKTLSALMTMHSLKRVAIEFFKPLPLGEAEILNYLIKSRHEMLCRPGEECGVGIVPIDNSA